MTDEPIPVAGDGSVVRRLVLREPTVPVLVLASVAMVRREYVPDILLVSGTAALIVIDAPRWQLRTASAEPTASDRPRWQPLTLALLVAGAMTPLPRQSHWLDAAFAVVGLVTLTLAWLPGREYDVGPDPRPPEPPRRWWTWPALGVVVALIELFSFLHDTAPRVDDAQHPTISTLVEPSLDAWPVRALVLWTWLLAGWWLWRRIQAWAT